MTSGICSTARPAVGPNSMRSGSSISASRWSSRFCAAAASGASRRTQKRSRGLMALRLQIVERPAAEGGEAGAEDQARVGEVGVGDDALDDRGLRFLEVGGDQGVDQALVVRLGRAFHRLAVF